MYMYVIEWVYRLLSLNPNHIIIMCDIWIPANTIMIILMIKAPVNAQPINEYASKDGN